MDPNPNLIVGHAADALNMAIVRAETTLLQLGFEAPGWITAPSGNVLRWGKLSGVWRLQVTFPDSDRAVELTSASIAVRTEAATLIPYLAAALTDAREGLAKRIAEATRDLEFWISSAQVKRPWT